MQVWVRRTELALLRDNGVSEWNPRATDWAQERPVPVPSEGGIVTVVEGGRRARRGFTYQDLVTLLDCLELGTLYSRVCFEDVEDIVCYGIAGDCVIYRQVKTMEGGGRQSTSSVTRPDKPKTSGGSKRVETSILGKLFAAKPDIGLAERFTLVLNEEPLPGLQGFCCDRTTEPTPTADNKTEIIDKLDTLALRDGCTIGDFVDALGVIVEGRTIQDVQRKLVDKLHARVVSHLGIEPFHADLKEILERLLAVVARDARAIESKEWTAAAFNQLLERVITQATGRRADGGEVPLPALAHKLSAAGLTEPEINAQNQKWLGYRREYRSAVGTRLQEFDRLSDEVHAVTVQINARRRAGEIADGPAAYAETIKALDVLTGRLGTSPALTLQTLSDVTSRCQNRYRDE